MVLDPKLERWLASGHERVDRSVSFSYSHEERRWCATLIVSLPRVDVAIDGWGDSPSAAVEMAFMNYERALVRGFSLDAPSEDRDDAEPGGHLRLLASGSSS